MFQQYKNIDTAFRHVRLFSGLVIMACTIITSLALYKSYRLASALQDRVYILAGGKVLAASASRRKDNIPVEARDHVKTFHRLFFTLDPDDKMIRTTIAQALYLADGSAKRAYDDLRESGYYADLISGNISQQIHLDSVRVNTNVYPYYFRCYATEQIIRATSIVSRSLITEGYLRRVSRSDNNPHGFLIERWTTLENKDLKIDTR